MAYVIGKLRPLSPPPSTPAPSHPIGESENVANPESFRKQLLTALTGWYPPGVKKRFLKKLVSYPLAETEKAPGSILRFRGFLASNLVAGVGFEPTTFGLQTFQNLCYSIPTPCRDWLDLRRCCSVEASAGGSQS